MSNSVLHPGFEDDVLPSDSKVDIPKADEARDICRREEDAAGVGADQARFPEQTK